MRFVKYNTFIENLIDLMFKVAAKFNNLDFTILLEFILENKLLLDHLNIKTYIENTLFASYTKFELENKPEEVNNILLMQNVINEINKML